MSFKGPIAEKTLFGSNMDSGKLISKVDYNDYFSGKWKHSKNIGVHSNFSFLFLLFVCIKINNPSLNNNRNC